MALLRYRAQVQALEVAPRLVQVAATLLAVENRKPTPQTSVETFVQDMDPLAQHGEFHLACDDPPQDCHQGLEDLRLNAAKAEAKHHDRVNIKTWHLRAEELYPVKEQRQEHDKCRQLGGEVLGVADALAQASPYTKYTQGCH